MRPGAPPQPSRYVYTGPGEVSSLITGTPGTPVIPCLYKHIIKYICSPDEVLRLYRRSTHRHTDTQTHRHRDTQTHRHTDTQTHTHTDTHAHRHTRTQTQTHTHTHTNARTHARTHARTRARPHTHTSSFAATGAAFK